MLFTVTQLKGLSQRSFSRNSGEFSMDQRSTFPIALIISILFFFLSIFVLYKLVWIFCMYACVTALDLLELELPDSCQWPFSAGN